MIVVISLILCNFLFSFKTLPYVGEIPGEITQDTALVFQGNFPADAKEYAPKAF